jgi:hypothetical protein
MLFLSPKKIFILVVNKILLIFMLKVSLFSIKSTGQFFRQLKNFMLIKSLLLLFVLLLL